MNCLTNEKLGGNITISIGNAILNSNIKIEKIGNPTKTANNWNLDA